MLSEVDVFFKKKSSTLGVTLQIREVENGEIIVIECDLINAI